MTAVEVAMQMTAEIHTLAQTMVRLDEWLRVARRQGEWTQIGELDAQRLETQARRSDLMYDAWCARKEKPL